jgi:hypothetical protein
MQPLQMCRRYGKDHVHQMRVLPRFSGYERVHNALAHSRANSEGRACLEVLQHSDRTNRLRTVLVSWHEAQDKMQVRLQDVDRHAVPTRAPRVSPKVEHRSRYQTHISEFGLESVDCVSTAVFGEELAEDVAAYTQAPLVLAQRLHIGFASSHCMS